MEFLFDSANLKDIETYGESFPITGVTSNPSILKAEGKIEFFPHLRKIRKLIGTEKTLHVQVVAEDFKGIIEEAHAILENVDKKVYIKVPTTEEGLKAIRALKAENVGVTATAIFTKIQGFMAIAAGSDFIAPYYNRMENLAIDPCSIIKAYRQMIDDNGASTKILAASFKNLAQVTNALLAGSHAVTVRPALLHEAFCTGTLQKAVNDFRTDWVKIHGETSIIDL
jgi:TalC/MipB family fructose-6-phosphate aldolase